MLSTLLLALIGGVNSFISTTAGSLFVLLPSKIEKLKHIRISIDFAIGVMLSATAFSLIGPEFIKAIQLGSYVQIQNVLAGLGVGMIFIGFMHKIVDRYNRKTQIHSSQLILALALVFHNFPEGMGAGASLAGLPLSEAMTIQVALSIQNVIEGLLLTVALLAMGLSMRMSIFGGVLSGVVEFSGAAISGLALQQSMNQLPFLLSLAGGAMLMSVLIELHEVVEEKRVLKKMQFVSGFLMVPVMNMLLQ